MFVYSLVYVYKNWCHVYSLGLFLVCFGFWFTKNRMYSYFVSFKHCVAAAQISGSDSPLCVGETTDELQIKAPPPLCSFDRKAVLSLRKLQENSQDQQSKQGVMVQPWPEVRTKEMFLPAASQDQYLNTGAFVSDREVTPTSLWVTVRGKNSCWIVKLQHFLWFLSFDTSLSTKHLLLTRSSISRIVNCLTLLFIHFSKCQTNHSMANVRSKGKN